MKDRVAPTTSLLSILFTTFHLTDDVVHGIPPGGLQNLPVVLVLSLLASGLPVIHMSGSAGATAGIGGAFFFAWTLLALGVTAIFSVILSARGLRSPRGQPR